MLNIKIMGKYEDESQLIEGKVLPDGAVGFREGKSLRDAFGLGLVLSWPIMIPMVILSIRRLWSLDKEVELNIYFAVVAIAMIVLGWVLTYVHEFIHAILYPKKSTKTIWKVPEQGAFFVYCDARVSKLRFIAICFAPVVILGIIPFIVWYILAPVLSGEWNVGLMMTIWWMTFSAIGDYANVFNTIRQVPKGARVFNYGMHSYWIK